MINGLLRLIWSRHSRTTGKAKMALKVLQDGAQLRATNKDQHNLVYL